MLKKRELWAQTQSFVKREKIFMVACVLALASSFVHRPSLSYIDFPVLGVLLSLMIVVGGLQKLKIMDYIALFFLSHCSSQKELARALVGVTFFSSMLITNDVALLVFVPLALVLGQSLSLDMGRIVIWQTLAANLGSALTPMGNPQNLFLYAHYAFTPWEFFGSVAVIALPAAFWLLWLLAHEQERNLKVHPQKIRIGSVGEIASYLLLLLLCFLTVMRVVDYRCTLILVIIAALASQRKLLVQVDYTLLATFAGFFIFIGNIAHLEAVRLIEEQLLSGQGMVYLMGILTSQFLSNVPAAMLLAGFTSEGRELLLGVNVGGLGTLIASMASVISYKFYVAEHPTQARSYLHMFLYYNFQGLILIGIVVYFLAVRV